MLPTPLDIKQPNKKIKSKMGGEDITMEGFKRAEEKLFSLRPCSSVSMLSWIYFFFYFKASFAL